MAVRVLSVDSLRDTELLLLVPLCQLLFEKELLDVCETARSYPWNWNGLAHFDYNYNYNYKLNLIKIMVESKVSRTQMASVIRNKKHFHLAMMKVSLRK